MIFKKICLVLILTVLLFGCSYQDGAPSSAPQALDHVDLHESPSSAPQVPDQSDQYEISFGDPETTSNEEKTLFLIYRYPNSYQEKVGDNGKSVSESDWLDDEVLQNGIQKNGWDYPLTQNTQIVSVAWDIYELCVSEGRMEADYVPYTAFYYSDGIWSISFLPEEDHGSYYDGKSYAVLISANDGHIIDFGIRY